MGLGISEERPNTRTCLFEPIDWEERFSWIRKVDGRLRVYMELYRKWMDITDRLHHLHQRTEKSGKTFVRLQIRRKAMNVDIQEQFQFTPTTLLRAYEKAIEQRAKIPSEILVCKRGGRVGIPHVNEASRCGKTPSRYIVSFSKSINGISTPVYVKTFSTMTYPNAFHHAVKHMFDYVGVEYPKNLFQLYVT